jgi:hypothetical protein
LSLKALLPCEGRRLTIDRRDVLTGLAATAASPALAQSSDVAQADAQMSQAKPLADILTRIPQMDWLSADLLAIFARKFRILRSKKRLVLLSPAASAVIGL